MVGDVCVSLRRKAYAPPEDADQQTSNDMPPPRPPPKITSTPPVPSSSSTPGQQYALTATSVSIVQSTSSLSSSPTPVQSHSIASSSGVRLCPKSLSEPLRPTYSTAKEEQVPEPSSESRTVALSRRPASRTAERQRSSDDSRDDDQGKSRKRRWSDPEH